MNAGTNGPVPLMGLGTYGRTGEEGARAILAGLELGYRHIDTAQSYDTEAGVGWALRASRIPRGDVFLTTKVATGNLARDRFLPSLRESLDRLGVEQVDLALIHWPSHGDAVPFAEYVEALGEARALGLTRLIGVSNFPVALLERASAILGPGAIVNDQVEVHVYLQNRKLCAYCARRGITVTAYVPLAKGRVAHEPLLRRIAARHGALPSQIALAWLMQQGIAVIPASSRREHMAANLKAQDIRLCEEEMAAIGGLDRGERIIDPATAPAWD
jgi:2,5-diketo-D-gluconate reductase B